MKVFSSRFASAAVVIAAMAGIAQAHTEAFITTMSGAAEAPPNASPGIGSSLVTFDLDLLTMRVQAQFSGLLGTVTVAHIHGPTAVAGTGTAGVATPTPTFPAFPAGVTAGTYDATFDMTLASSYNPAFVTASGGTISLAFERLLNAMRDGKAYLNIHTTFASGGEIRGFYAVPAPGAAALLGCAGLIATRRRR